MLTSHHPNAIWLADLYRGMSAIESDTSLSKAEREARANLHLAQAAPRMSPDLIIHTAGIRLAVTGDFAFMRAYGKRRTSLSDSFVALTFDQFLADDHFGIIHGTFRTARGDDVWERTAMGAWRFENGIAVEHWELDSGPRWDAFYLSGDPDGASLSGTAFWTKA